MFWTNPQCTAQNYLLPEDKQGQLIQGFVISTSNHVWGNNQ